MSPAGALVCRGGDGGITLAHETAGGTRVQYERWERARPGRGRAGAPRRGRGAVGRPLPPRVRRRVARQQALPPVRPSLPGARPPRAGRPAAGDRVRCAPSEIAPGQLGRAQSAATPGSLRHLGARGGTIQNALASVRDDGAATLRDLTRPSRTWRGKGLPDHSYAASVSTTPAGAVPTRRMKSLMMATVSVGFSRGTPWPQ